jgi:hypothetical protein
MRVLVARVLTAVVFVVAPVACGLDAGGRLVVADSGTDALAALDDDAATAVSSDGDVTDTPSPSSESGTQSDAAPDVPHDAAPTGHPDGSAPPGDAAPDAPATCASCIDAMCPTQVAACGAGSACLGYRDCDVACSASSSSVCTTTCGTKYPGGEATFAALTICGLRCGAGCAAALTIGTP